MEVQGLVPRYMKAAVIILAVLAAAAISGCAYLYSDIRASEKAWEQERAGLSQNVQTLTRENVALRENVSELESRLAAGEKSEATLAEIRSAIAAAKSELDEVNTRREVTLEKSTAAAAKLATAADTLKSLNEKLSDRQEALSVLEKSVSQKQSEVSETAARLAEIRAETDDAKKGVRAAERTLADLSTAITAGERDVRALRSYFDEAKGALEKALSHIEKARGYKGQ